MKPKSMSLVSIGKRIELEKTRMGMKSLDVCLALDIHPNTYRNYELGRRDMPVSKMAMLEAIGFDAVYILTGVRSSALDSDKYADEDGIHHHPKNLVKDYFDDSQSNELLSAMNNVENTLKRAGASAGADYNYVDLAKIGVQLLQYRASLND